MSLPSSTPPVFPRPALISPWVGSAPTMSSREIAELTGSSHDNVLKTVRALRAKGVVSGNDTPYVHPQNGQTYTEIRLNYRDTMVVVSGYSVELRARIIDRWQELEAATERQAAFAQLPDFTNPAIAARAWADEREARDIAEHRAAELAPKAAIVDRLEAATGDLVPTDAAKAIKIGPKKLFDLLEELGWAYRRDRRWVGSARALDTGYVSHRTDVRRTEFGDLTTLQLMITPKGRNRLSQILNDREICAESRQ